MIECRIVNVGKGRNGKNRYWCIEHYAPAFDKNGNKLEKCRAKKRKIDVEDENFCIMPSDYPGGVALWGSTLAVYDTTPFPVTNGIHVHARKVVGGEKQIDRTFDSVKVIINGHIAMFSKEAAVYYLCANVLNQHMEYVDCPHCGSPHLDKDRYAVIPHKKHLCISCGHYFYTKSKCIGNPIVREKQVLGDDQIFRKIIHPNRSLEIMQRDFPYGISLWGSTGAFLWTAKKPEEYGIHVHAYKENTMKPSIDETYDMVTIDGITLNIEHIRMYMVQNTLPYLQNCLMVIKCKECGETLFDDGENAFIPSKQHICKKCGCVNITGKKIISNPAINTLNELSLFSGLPRKNICIQELYPDLIDWE